MYCTCFLPSKVLDCYRYTYTVFIAFCRDRLVTQPKLQFILKASYQIHQTSTANPLGRRRKVVTRTTTTWNQFNSILTTPFRATVQSVFAMFTYYLHCYVYSNLSCCLHIIYTVMHTIATYNLHCNVYSYLRCYPCSQLWCCLLTIFTVTNIF